MCSRNIIFVPPEMKIGQEVHQGSMHHKDLESMHHKDQNPKILDQSLY